MTESLGTTDPPPSSVEERSPEPTQVVVEGSGGDSLSAILMRREKVVISPIPPPEELERYREISPEIVETWLETWRGETRWRQVLAGAEASGVATVIGAIGGLLTAYLIGRKSGSSADPSSDES